MRLFFEKLYKRTPFIIAIIVGISIAILRSRSIKYLKYVWGLMESIKGLVLATNEFVVSRKEKILTTIIIATIFACISYLIASMIKKWIDKAVKRRKVKDHFRCSFAIVKKEMLPSLDKMVSTNTKEINNKIDKFIQSPLEYVNETVKGNSVPDFKPDDPSQEIIFKAGIRYIVAITAENPNLWMDPTVCFYMANCYAVSLINQTNEVIDKAHNTNKRIKRMIVKDREEIANTMETKREEIIKKLSSKAAINTFEFIRFFMFTNEQKESCENVVFPSLKAAQDLFRTHSFYINKDNMKYNMGGNWGDFSEVVRRLWSLFDETPVNNGRKAVLDIRKKEVIPEFLLLYFDEKIEIQSYLNGIPVKKEIKKNTKYKAWIKKDCDYGDIIIMEDISKLVSSIAYYVKDKEYQDDTAFMNNEILVNNYNAFIDWELG